MKLHVKLFATLKDQVGMSNVSIEFADNMDAEKLKESLKRNFPILSNVLDVSRVAVNEEFVEDDHIIQEEDIVALIPPSSGG